MPEGNTSSPSGSADDGLTIAEIQTKGAGRDRVCVILSDGSSFFVLKDVQLELGLCTGLPVTRQSVAEATALSDLRSAEKAAISLLSRAPHTRDVLKLKLKKRGYAEQTCQTAIGKMRDLGYIDDRQFGRDWIAMRLERHPEGKTAMVAGLRKRGIERSLAEELVGTIVSSEVEEQCLLRVLARYGDRLKGRKLASKLAARGFSFELIRRHVPEL